MGYYRYQYLLNGFNLDLSDLRDQVKQTILTSSMGNLTEVGNVPSKCNGVTRYRLCHVLKAITLTSDNGSNIDTAITLRRDNGSMYQGR